MIKKILTLLLLAPAIAIAQPAGSAMPKVQQGTSPWISSCTQSGTWSDRITDGTDTAQVEAAATYSTGLDPATMGLTVNSRAQQIWDSSHPDNAGAGADGHFYGQNQDSNGNLSTNLSSVRGKLLRFKNQIGTTISGTNPPSLPIGGYGASSAPSDVTAGRAVDAYFDLKGRLATFSDVAIPAGSAIIGKVTTDQTTPGTTDLVHSAQQGTWTVQPGNTANTTPWLTQVVPGTSGGLSTYHLVSAGSTNATNIKASAGQVCGWYIYNSNASMRKVVFHNTAGSPTAGASIFFTLPIPPGGGANVFSDHCVAFSTGIAITTVTGLADSDNTAVAANDLIIDIFYK